jgi:hypothetical protein
MQPHFGGKSAAVLVFAASLLTGAPAICFSQSSPQPQSPEDARIQAVAEFLIDRAKANFFYIFERRIAEDETVRCYFPTVYSYVRYGDLQSFLKTKGLWEESVKTDSKDLLTKAAARAAVSADLQGVGKEITQSYQEFLKQVEVLDNNNKRFRLSTVPNELPPELQSLVEGLKKVSDAHKYINDLAIEVDAARTRGADEERRKNVPENLRCNIPDLTTAKVKELAGKARDAADVLDKWRKLVKDNESRIKPADQKIDSAAFHKKWEQEAKRFEHVLNQVKQVADKFDEYEKVIAKKLTSTEQVLLALRIIRETAAIQNAEMIESLRKYVLFFAEAADATTKDQMKGVLAEYTLPPVSFGLKRERLKGHATIAAYLGYGAATVVHPGSGPGRGNNDAVFAPIGLDASLGEPWVWVRDAGHYLKFWKATAEPWGWLQGSVSFMLAPFDFGYPVSLKLNGVKEELELSDVVAPSVILAYGFPKYPVALGWAYQWGRKDPTSGVTETRRMIFFAFDLPLFPLF